MMATAWCAGRRKRALMTQILCLLGLSKWGEVLDNRKFFGLEEFGGCHVGEVCLVGGDVAQIFGVGIKSVFVGNAVKPKFRRSVKGGRVAACVVG